MNNTNDILSVINDHGFLDTDTNTKLAFLNDAIADFCSREPWPFLEAQPVTLTFDGVTSKAATGMPANLRAVTTIVDANSGRKLRPERIDNLERSHPTRLTQTGTDPFAYYFIGSELHFVGIPTASFTARLRYIQYHPDVTVDTDATGYLVPQRFWMSLVFGTLIKLYDLDDDPEMSTRYEQHFESRIQAIREELWQRQFDRSDSIVIADPDYHDYH